MGIESWKLKLQNKIIHPDDLEKKIEELRNNNKSIASLNGSFDLLHAGHLKIILEGGDQADVLIVALNSDDSIKQYKSPDRPIVPLEYRIQMMAALEAVDYVTWFEETTPFRILDIIKPDIHVNGSEYGKNCIEAEQVRENGGEIYVCELAPGLSTSQIITKILKEEKQRC